MHNIEFKIYNSSVIRTLQSGVPRLNGLFFLSGQGRRSVHLTIQFKAWKTPLVKFKLNHFGNSCIGLVSIYTGLYIIAFSSILSYVDSTVLLDEHSAEAAKYLIPSCSVKLFCKYKNLSSRACHTIQVALDIYMWTPKISII